MESLGELGYHFFDVHRNVIFGIASILTLISTALFLFGVSAFAEQQRVLSISNWAVLETKYSDGSTAPIFYKFFFGLRAMVVNSCPSENSSLVNCKPYLLLYSDSQCSKLGFIGDFCNACGKAASSEATAAAFTAISKFLSLFGMQRRMYKVADSTSFKLYAICIEIVGSISLLTSLLEFKNICMDASFDAMEDPTKKYHSYLSNNDVNYGSAYLCYAFGVIAALLRLIVHVLTPLPYRGKGIIAPFIKIFTRCDGCCILYVDDEEDEKRRSELGIKHVPLNSDDGTNVSRMQPLEVENA